MLVIGAYGADDLLDPTFCSVGKSYDRVQRWGGCELAFITIGQIMAAHSETLRLFTYTIVEDPAVCGGLSWRTEAVSCGAGDET
jgi:hypothetical protein